MRPNRAISDLPEIGFPWSIDQSHIQEAELSLIKISSDNGIATIIMTRGKVNAINMEMVAELQRGFGEIENDDTARTVIFTGNGKFFSFGFDIPELLTYSKEKLIEFLTGFTGLYTYLYTFPKPLIAALNGHAIAGGCMLASACDFRIMADGKAKIGLNEINIWASVFAGSVEMLKSSTSGLHAHRVLLEGGMYNAQEALELGLVDKVYPEDDVMNEALKIAHEYAKKSAAAFRSIKMLLRRPVADTMIRREKDSIDEFVEIWLSEETRKILEKVEIRS